MTERQRAEKLFDFLDSLANSLVTVFHFHYFVDFFVQLANLQLREKSYQITRSQSDAPKLESVVMVKSDSPLKALEILNCKYSY